VVTVSGSSQSGPRAFEDVVAGVVLQSAPRAFEAVVTVPASLQSAPKAFEDVVAVLLLENVPRTHRNGSSEHEGLAEYNSTDGHAG